MSTCYVFDVDGTLTHPREEIDPVFSSVFTKWSAGKQLYIATGSDFDKTKQQLPQDVLNLFKGIFCCMGNELRSPSGTILERSDFVIPDDLNDDLADILNKSEYTPKVGKHIEFRTGMVNFTTLGRNATLSERNAYNEWDRIHKEREKIADFINTNYPKLDASVGGSISIDIIEKGKDKGQIVPWLLDKGVSKLTFVGDRCFEGGNDWGVVRELTKTLINFGWHNVNGPDDVLNLLKSFK